MPVSFAKLSEADPSGQLVSFRKAADRAAGIVFSKSPHMFGHVAKCGLVMDASGSERDNYRNGSMQALAERVLALATRFDDDGEIDIFPFSTHAARVQQLNISSFHGGIDRMIHVDGVTNYAAVIEQVAHFYGYSLHGESIMCDGRRVDPSPIPTGMPSYVVFQTDGAPYDGHSQREAEEAARRALIAASRLPIFWVFAAIGDESDSHFDFLHEVDEGLPGRLIDNASFFAFRDVRHVDEETLYGQMLEEYPAWVLKAQEAGILLPA